MSYIPITIDRLSLKRYPKNKDITLRAWSAADQYLLEYIQQNQLYLTKAETQSPAACLIVNDQFGALTTSLNQLAPDYWSDSFLSNHAINQNLTDNFPEDTAASPWRVSFQIDHQKTVSCFPDSSRKFDLVILRVPKHNSLLKFQLTQIKPWLAPRARVIAAGMCKDIHNSNLKIFESIIGPTQTSLAKKKARLIFSQPNNEKPPCSQLKCYSLAEPQLDIYSMAGVFSGEKLDMGTRVLLAHLPQFSSGQKIIDLGCGSGVIGAIIAQSNPQCQLLLTDESRAAVESAKITFTNNQLTNGIFHQTNVLSGVTRRAYDHILCNPPFHQQNVQMLDIAHEMFKQSAQCLKPSGQLLVVANRHLKYQPFLKRFFSLVKPISSDQKFTVWLAKSPKHSSLK